MAQPPYLRIDDEGTKKFMALIKGDLNGIIARMRDLASKNELHELDEALDELEVSLGDLAYKNSAEATYTPAGSVSAPTFTGAPSPVTMNITDDENGNYQPKGSVSAPEISVLSAGATTTIKNPTKETVVKSVDAVAPGGTAPSNPITYCEYDSATETLYLYQLGSTRGDSISTSDVTVKTGDASYTASEPTFTGAKASIEGSVTPAGSVSAPTFSGTQETITAS